MTKTLILPVPEVVHAVYLVAAPLWIPPEPGAGTLALVDVVDGREPPLPWLVQAGECPRCARCGLEHDNPVVRRLREAGRHLRVTATGPAAWPPDHLTVAASVAYDLAERTGGVLVDAATADLEPWARPPDPFDVPEGFAAAEWLSVAGLPDPAPRRSWTLCTRGLRIFGLPELRVRRITSRQRSGWTEVLLALAQRLLREHWAALARPPIPAFREFPAGLAVTAADLGAALARCPHGRARTRLSLRLDPGFPGRPAHLTVTAPGSRPSPLWRERALTDLGL
ncbi:hypothetical protein [Actinocorallia populi]|uniref:hypothetical protein n=1 Tax=Actinocorallia populi TaxID=2079200 RepID=UPI000D095445|nr:hypothetical protein [Actinocorallia populi]